nr:sphingolipid delta(4)-desaturase DES1-like [Tanacetum cinerariifolium]
SSAILRHPDIFTTKMSSSVTTATMSMPETTARPRQSAGKEQGYTAAKEAQEDFFWTYTEEPHRTRRQAIIKAHPEVLKLCGPEPW